MIHDARGISTAEVALGAFDLPDAASCEVLLGQLQAVLRQPSSLAFPGPAAVRVGPRCSSEGDCRKKPSLLWYLHQPHEEM